MRPITSIEKTTFMPLKEVQDTFPSVTRDTVYQWRSKTKRGVVDPGHYPRSLIVNGEVYFVRNEIIQWINEQFAKQAS